MTQGVRFDTRITRVRNRVYTEPHRAHRSRFPAQQAVHYSIPPTRHNENTYGSSCMGTRQLNQRKKNQFLVGPHTKVSFHKYLLVVFVKECVVQMWMKNVKERQQKNRGVCYWLCVVQTTDVDTTAQKNRRTVQTVVRTVGFWCRYKHVFIGRVPPGKT